MSRIASAANRKIICAIRQEAGWIDKIQRALMTRNFRDAENFITAASLEFPDDSELSYLKKRLDEAFEKSDEAQSLFEEGQRLAAAGDRVSAIRKLHAARELDESDPAIRAALVTVLGDHARSLIEQDWRAALLFVEEAHSIDPGDPGIINVSQLLEEAKRREQIERLSADVRNLTAKGQPDRALAKVEQCLREYPDDVVLLQLLNKLRNAEPFSSPAGGGSENISSASAANPQAKSAGAGAAWTSGMQTLPPTWQGASDAGPSGLNRVLPRQPAPAQPNLTEPSASGDAARAESQRTKAGIAWRWGGRGSGTSPGKEECKDKRDFRA